jgi:hypothetical protein
LEAKSVELLRVIPFAQVHDEVDALASAHGGDAEEGTQIEHSKAPDLDVVA